VTVLGFLIPLGLSGVLVFLIVWVTLAPHKVEKVSGWLWSGLSWAGRAAKRKAIAFKVQSEINDARATALKNAPDNVIEGQIRIKFHRAETAKAAIDGGDVVVFMRPRRHHAENVAHALMAYLPKAVLPRARRYLDEETMRAADLTLAKAVLAHEDRPRGALECFYDNHLDPAAETSENLKIKLAELDEIDLHGWLIRVLLAEYRCLGERLYPGARHPAVVQETARFESWLHELASLGPGDQGSLRFEGKLMRIAVIFVALSTTLETKGIEPYRKRAKSLIYSGRVDAVYLMARDHNIPALKRLVESLDGDGRIAELDLFEYRLRSDFAARRLPRDRAALACLQRRTTAGEKLVPIRLQLDDDAGLPDRVYRPEATEASEGQPSSDSASAA
jgi:hypothetical protein